MNETDLKHIIEATLLAAGKPVTSQQLLELFDERERPSAEQLTSALGALAEDYAARGVELVEVASGWRIQVRPRVADVVSRLWQERPARYSRALLETLALIAYRQPITRSEIEEIRGVSISSTIMRTLQERNWIRIVGHREVPGRPELLGTTRDFLDYFGLKSLDQLPTLAELKDVETIGVQLELPGGEPSAEGTAESPAETETAAADEAREQVDSATATDETESSAALEASSEDADADEDGENAHESNDDEPELSADDADEATPTLVASAEEGVEQRFAVRDPAREQD